MRVIWLRRRLHIVVTVVTSELGLGRRAPPTAQSSQFGTRRPLRAYLHSEDTLTMQNIDEKQAVTQVCERLAERFPELPAPTIRLAVDQEHRKLDGRPVRDYVPVLVERAAREALATISGPGTKVLTSH